MDRETLRGALEAATRRVLEEAAFVFTEPTVASPDETIWPGPVVQAQLPFTGPIRGHFLLAAPSRLCGPLVADMVGVADGGEEVGAVLGEILNMVAGMTLGQTLGAEELWELGVPEVKSVTPAEQVSGPRPEVWVRLDTEEDEPVEVAVFFQSGLELG